MAQPVNQATMNQGMNPEEMSRKKQEEEEKKNQIEQMKNQMLSQILDQQARARLNTLKLAKPEKAQGVEQLLLNMAQMGQIRSKIGETEFISLLEQVSMKKSPSVKFDRRRNNLMDDDDDESYLDDL